MVRGGNPDDAASDANGTCYVRRHQNDMKKSLGYVRALGIQNLDLTVKRSDIPLGSIAIYIDAKFKMSKVRADNARSHPTKGDACPME